MIDFGITYTKEKKKKTVKKSSAGKIKNEEQNPQSLNETEEKFIQAYSSQGTTAYNSFLSFQSRLNYRVFCRPPNSEKERNTLVDSLPGNIEYTILGFGCLRKRHWLCLWHYGHQ